MIDNAFLNASEVAELLRRSEAAIRQMTYRRQLPCRRLGRRVVYIRSEIEQIIDQSPGVRPDEVRLK